jgi:uncharacterized protein
MTFQEFDNEFKSHVTKLNFELRLDLALKTCKKLFFDYQQFYEENAWGDPDLLLDAINLIEQSKIEIPEPSTLSATIKDIEEITPDTEDFSEAGFALNACTAIYYTLNFLIEDKPEYIYYVGNALYDTIYAKLEGENNLSEEEINQHPMMIEVRKYLLG